MKFYDIKFSFKHELIGEKHLDIIFNKIRNLLDVRFDENLIPYYQKNDEKIYKLKEVTDEANENEMGTFFKFTFKDMIDVPLYKFLVLKRPDELTVLANIHSSIFDYSSINIIKEIFNNPEATNIPKNISSYFDEYDEYLNSADFEDDCVYWDNKLLDAENYVKYFNIKSNNYQSIAFSPENDSLSTFLKNHKISKYNFFTAIFSLYLSRIDSTKGCLLKSSINRDEVVFRPYAKNTLLMIDYYKNETFEEYLNRIRENYKEAINHTQAHIEDYIDNSFYYAIHDFTNLKDVDVKNGDGSTLTFNIYEDSIDIIYNHEIFSEIYIRYMIENIKHLIDNVLEGINQRCGDLEVLSTGNQCDFNGLYQLTETQRTVYSDAQNDTGTRYNNPLKLGLGNSYSATKIKKALNKLLKIHPILTSRIIGDGYLIGFDAKPPILTGSAEDIETFVHPFELNNYLSRFLIVEDNDDVFLCMDFHSLIFDANSFNTLINSLLKILNGENTELVDTGILREISFEEVVNNSEYEDYAQKFFDSTLSERDDVSDLVFSIAEDSSKSYVERFSIDEEDLTSFLDNHNITHEQFFTSVFAYTLSRFTGSSKVLFNILSDGRTHLGLYDSVGMFFQTYPVIMECDNQSVESFMNYSREIIDTVSRYDLYSFMELAFDYQRENSVSFGVLQDIFSHTIDMDFEMLEKDMGDNFSVRVYYAKEDTLEIRILYSEKYSDNFVKHFSNSFKLILEGIIKEEMLSDINYVDESDLKILDSYNKTENNLMFDDILEAFNVNLFKNPMNPLVSYKDNVYSYSQGAFIADKLASALKDVGIDLDDNVAFLVERSELYMFCILGVLSTGAAYVPLDDAHPDERIKFILNDTDSNVVIVSDETFNRVKSLNGDAIIINISDIVNGEIGELNSLPTVNGDIACILYTSGSTGLPKGVKVTRKAILNSVESYANKYKMTNEDVYGLFATIGFNTASLGICQSFYLGACLSVVPGEIKLDMVKLNDYFTEQGVTHTLITTQVGKLYMRTIEESPLKIILVAGEKLGEFDNTNNYRFVDGFGLTEVFSFITSICDNKKIDSSSIGGWNFNTKIYILDDELRRVPVGAVGELCISGYQVSDGYLNREEENNKAFVKNPFDDSKDYEVLFRSGDMVRILPDGTLGIIGRQDSQVKIRGNRVELSEVESVIRQLDYVSDVSAQTVKHESNNELVVYVVVDNDFDEDELRKNVLEHVGKYRPPFMVPSYVIKMDKIPLNVHGKVDKRALPDINRDRLRAEYVAPTNEVEKSIVRVFKIIFDREDIGILDDFVRLGGDSLTAIKVLSYLSEYNFSTADILSLRTPQAIAANMNDDNKFDLDVYSLKEGCPLNEPQLNVYLDIIANEKVDAYNLPFFMNISKDYALSDIEDALDIMFDFHPILRMHVSDDFEVPYMVNGRKPSISLLHAIDNDVIREFLTEPFDLYDSLSRFLIVETEDKYGLFAVFHHLVYDASSKHIFKRDLQTILDGGSIILDDSFLKVAAFNQQIKDTKEFKEAEKFYASVLIDSGDAGILLEDVLGDGPGFYQTTLEIDEDRFKRFLNEYNISENILFTSVFAYTLSRFIGNDNVLFHINENGRDRFNNFDSIGMYVNTLPLIIDCNNINVNEFIRYVSDRVYNVVKHNYYPFRLLANQHDIDSNVIFQYLPEWIEYTNNNADNLDIENEIIPYLNDSVNDLVIDVRKIDEDYSLNITYSAKFSKDMALRFAESYNLVLSQIMNVKELSEINYVSQSDLKLLDSYNKTEGHLIYDDVLDAFNDNLANNPDNILVTYEDNSYSYSEGAFVCNKIANILKDEGVKEDDYIAFLVNRSELYMFSVLGILAAGAVYVPLDDSHPDERIEFILKDTKSKAIIASDKTYDRAKRLSDGVSILNISDILKDDIGTLSEIDVSYGNLACILYTSGTTGVPKGVKISRKSVLNVAESYIKSHGLNNSDVYGLYSAIGFDVTSFVITAVLCAGACLSVIPEDIRLDMLELNNYFVKQNVSHVFITTQVGKLFMQSVYETSLDVLLVAGEKLGEFESPKEYNLIDAYGPTEAFAFVSSINNKDKLDESSVGMLNHNTGAYILDNQQRRVPVGAVGELYLSGYQVADGYLNRDEENAKAFIENPFCDEEDYKTLYRTGDLVRLLPDGTLGIVGRRDSQVKIRGNRLELSEVEAVIREIDYVNDLTVQTIKNGNNNELVAYVVVNNEMDENKLKDSISDFVGERKPEYMIPSFVIKLDKIPLNVNGKVDKRALPKVDLESLHIEYVAPTTDSEKLIVEAFKNIFNQDKISVLDDFVRLGGDSLTAIKLLSELKEYNITAADVLSLRTPKAISDNIDNDSLDLNIYTLETGCPLNESQLNVYLDVIANNKFGAYIIPLVMDISKKYTVDSIKSALDEILNVHPILTMCISDEYDVPYLIKGNNPSISVVSDINNEFIIDFITKEFDLKDSLSRFLIVENEENYSLFAAFHHIVFDALSGEVFKKNLHLILDNNSIELDDSFLKVSAFSQEIQETEEYHNANKFYDEILADIEETRDLLGSISSDGFGFYNMDLNLDYTLFKSFLDENNVNENVLFTSIFAYTLSRFVGSEKVLFNINENGRDRFNNFDAIGMFVNTLPILVDCKDKEISNFLDYMSNLVYDVMKYNYYPFRLLVSEYNINSSILFQYMPEWISYEEDEINIESIYDDMLENMNDFFTDFACELVQKGETYSLRITYSDKYSRDLVEHFSHTYRLILSQIICGVELSDVNYVSESDLETLDNINQTVNDLVYEDVLDAFNDHLSKYPDNRLVLSDESSYTYAEGAYLISQIQDLLNKNNIDVNDKVCVFVDRGCWILLADMAVLAQGATYVPIDENHPDARIEYMIEKSQSKAIIVSATFQERVNDIIEQSDLDLIVINVSSIDSKINELTSLNYVNPTSNDVACILFTSGTTGNPKAVQVGRFSITNMVSYYADNSNFTFEDVYGVFASVGFDVSLQHYAAILCGGSVTWVPNDIRLNINELNKYFIKHNVTHTIITTQVSKLFVSNVKNTSIKNLCAVGEKMGQISAPADYDFVDVYGPTEATSSITSINVKDKIDDSSVGGPDWNTKIYVLDREQRRVPIGATGELYISGYQVSKGYLNNPEANKKAFFDNPFDGKINGYGRMYKTGDVVRLLPDGTVGFIGRNDLQVKVRGNRLELPEVESTIRQMDIIDDVTVQTIKNGDNNELVAYVVSGELDDDVVRDAVQEYVSDNKPEYMIPSFVIKLDEIPLNVNGKVDKHALPEVNVEGLQVEYVAPTTETEKHIVEAFENVFNQKNIGIYDDFVHLGGDSLTAIKIISILSKYDITVNARVIFDSKTPYQIAKFIDEDQTEYGFYLAKEGTIDQNMFILPPIAGISMVFSTLIDNIEFEGNIYLIDDFKHDLTIDEVRNTDHNMTFEKYWEAIKDIFHDGDIIAAYSLGCIYSMLIVEKLEKYKKIEKCILIDGPLDFHNDKVPKKEDALNLINQLFDLGLDVDELGPENHDELIDKIFEILTVNMVWDFPTAKINDTPIIYLSSDHEYGSRLEDITRNGEIIFIEGTDHLSIVTTDVKKIVKYLK